MPLAFTQEALQAIVDLRARYEQMVADAGGFVTPELQDDYDRALLRLVRDGIQEEGGDTA